MPISKPPYIAKPELHVLYEHFGTLTEQILTATKLHKAPLNIGATRELFVGTFLRRHLPRSLWVARGEILDSTGARSGDCDVVVARSSSPAIPSDPGESIYLFLAEGVDSVVEVKSFLTSDELAGCMESCRRIKGLRTGNHPEGDPGTPDIAIVPRGYNREPLNRIRYFVVAFDGLSTETVSKKLAASYASPEDYYRNGIDGVCILDRAYVYKNDGLVWPDDHEHAGKPMLVRQTDDLLCLYLHLVSAATFTIHKSTYFADYLQRGAADGPPVV